MSRDLIEDNREKDDIFESAGDIETVAAVESEMKKSYGAYAMSVIVGRALPDVRDGLKPGPRRILYAMYDTGNSYDKPYRKSARVVGEVMGKYHPHGDSSIYASLVRMTQSFSLRAPLLDGQGNFGTIDGDSAAAMRYTEIRCAKLANLALLCDIDKDTVDFQENYDGSEQEPKVIPARFPNLLVNGASGIAVGMATNIPTFNLGEVIDATCHCIDNPDTTPEELLEYLPAPDFPTGGTLVGYDKVRKAMIKGHGSITIRGKAEIETVAKRERIVISEIPYQVNKSEMIKNIEALSRNKDIDGITDIRDESNKLGIRVVVELRRDINSGIVLNQIFKMTQLEVSFGVNTVALRDGQPALMNCLQIINDFIKFRQEVIVRRCNFLMNKARTKAHTLIGMLIAIENIEEIVEIIKSSRDKNHAKEVLYEKLWVLKKSAEMIIKIDQARNPISDQSTHLTLDQINAILEMKLQRLTGLESTKIITELDELAEEIAGYLKILGSKSELFALMKKEMSDIKDMFGMPRKTDITHDEMDMNDEDFIQNEKTVVTITRGGYIKRTSLDLYREQRRGGRGKNIMNTHNDDIVTEVIVTTTHRNILFFSDQGKVYRLKVYKIPEGSPQSKGRALINLISVDKGEKITSILELGKEHFEKLPRSEVAESDATGISNSMVGNNSYSEDSSSELSAGNTSSDIRAREDDASRYYLFFATQKGLGRRNSLDDFRNIPSNGKIAIKLEDDQLIGVALCKFDDHIMLSTKQGKAIRFAIGEVRVFRGRTSSGVRAIRLLEGNCVVSLAVIKGMSKPNEIKDLYVNIPVNDRIKVSAKLKLLLESDEANATEQMNQIIAKVIAKHELPIVLDESVSNDMLDMFMNEQFILSVTSNGFGKKTSIYEYRPAGRGGQGVASLDVNKRSGEIVSSFPVQNEDSIMLVTDGGCIIRVAVSGIRITGRSATGVKIIDLQKGDFVSSVSKVKEDGGCESEGIIE